MDLEQLTKHQIVLLTLLVSFVTSVATGIVTVSLVNQAPPEVQRTINQIVERTVEVASALPEQPAAAATATETTVVVKEDDLAAESIAAVQKAIIRIVSRSAPEVLLARGVILSPDGTAISDRAALVEAGTRNLDAILYSGERVPIAVRAGTSSIAVLDVAVTPEGFAPATAADLSKVKLGQSVIRIGGSGADTVGMGVVAALPHNGVIEASVPSATPGSILITLFGEVVGIRTAASQTLGSDYYNTPTSP